LGIPFVQLDGSVNIKKRHDLVMRFNAPPAAGVGGAEVFLLSSKAGGCGINLIGANRLIMFDADWNPASDKQAMARVWREGQKKECWIYRLFSTGTIEEKILQRQINKDSLTASIVGNDSLLKEGLSRDEMKNLFSLRSEEILSDTHNVIQCTSCRSNRTVSEYTEEDLKGWDHLTGQEMTQRELLVTQGCLEGLEDAISMAMYCAIDKTQK
jgi:DNA repair and recombination RAD54-like protein